MHHDKQMAGYVLRSFGRDSWLEPVPCFAPVRESVCREVERGWEAPIPIDKQTIPKP